jgi:hypothetical protein
MRIIFFIGDVAFVIVLAFLGISFARVVFMFIKYRIRAKKWGGNMQKIKFRFWDIETKLQ